MNHTKYCFLFIKNCSKRLIIHCLIITIECLLISIAHDTAAKRWMLHFLLCTSQLYIRWKYVNILSECTCFALETSRLKASLSSSQQRIERMNAYDVQRLTRWISSQREEDILNQFRFNSALDNQLIHTFISSLLTVYRYIVTCIWQELSV